MPRKMPDGKNLLDCLQEIMRDGSAFTPYNLQSILNYEYGRFHSDSTITMGLRKLRDLGYKIEVSRIKGTNSNEYKIVGKKL